MRLFREKYILNAIKTEITHRTTLTEIPYRDNLLDTTLTGGDTRSDILQILNKLYSDIESFGMFRVTGNDIGNDYILDQLVADFLNPAKTLNSLMVNPPGGYKRKSKKLKRRF